MDFFDYTMDNNKIDFGNCAEIYKYKDECLKIYFDSCLYENRISVEEFKILKNIKHENFVELYKLIYKMKDNKIIYGYTMKYYKKEEFEITKNETQYVLYQMEKLFELITKLSTEHIIVDDLKKENIIFNDNNIIIIDPDLFYKTNLKINIINKTNYKELLKLFKQMFLTETYKYFNNDNNPNPYHALDELFDIETNKNLVNNFSKKIKRYKYPIDYFIDKNK